MIALLSYHQFVLHTTKKIVVKQKLSMFTELTDSISISNTIGSFYRKLTICIFKYNLPEQYMDALLLNCQQTDTYDRKIHKYRLYIQVCKLILHHFIVLSTVFLNYTNEDMFIRSWNYVVFMNSF